MTFDIVDLLQLAAKVQDEIPGCAPRSQLLVEAAAEIVRLRAVISDLHGKISWLDGYEDINP